MYVAARISVTREEEYPSAIMVATVAFNNVAYVTISITRQQRMA